jgi:uncharacterized protein (TIRG00374 family)
LEENLNNSPSQRPLWRRIIGAVIRYGLPLAISVLLCISLFTGVNFNEMLDIIRDQCDWRWIGLCAIVTVLSHVVRAMRWNIQLKALGIKAPLFYITLSIFGTYAVNLVLPRLGELWRTGYIAKRQNAPFSTVFGSMVADRLSDTVTVLTLTIVTFLLASSALSHYFAQNSATISHLIDLATSPIVWAAAIAVIALAWWMLSRKTDNKVIIKIQGFFSGLWNGFAAVGTMPGKGKWLLLTFAIWGCYFLQLFLAFFAFDFTTDIVLNHGVIAVLVTFVLSSISMGVPSNGGIGPWQWAVIFALGIYGLDKAPATAFANLVLGANTLVLIALGIFTFVCIAIDNRKRSRLLSK